jgi:hypothetical protein
MDCRLTIRFLISASRSITSVLIDSKLAPSDLSLTMQPKQLSPKETLIFIKLLKNCLVSLDIYMIGRSTSSNANSTNTTTSATPPLSASSAPTANTSKQQSTTTTTSTTQLSQAALLAQQKEEKESIETLGSIYAQLNVQTLKEIFTQTIDFLIERTFKNANLTALSSYFLATPATSCTFATILIEYLLKQMELMGDSSIERWMDYILFYFTVV